MVFLIFDFYWNLAVTVDRYLERSVTKSPPRPGLGTGIYLLAC